MKSWIKPLAAPLLSAVFACSAASAEEADQYKVLLSLESGFSTGTYAKPCTLDASKELQCDGPIIDLSGKSISALLQSEDNGSLVLCNFQKISTEPGSEALFDSMKNQIYIKGEPNALSLAESLRPLAAQPSGSLSYGSCQPYETQLSAKQIEAIKSHEQWPSYKQLEIGLGDPLKGAGMSWGVSIIIDEAKEHRLWMDRALKDQFPVIRVPSLFDPSETASYFSVNGGACENTGDFALAEKIEDAFSKDGKDTIAMSLTKCPRP